jgi:murein DD-endopeptidase MepM/ murein hydrolase activator NlpD
VLTKKEQTRKLYLEEIRRHEHSDEEGLAQSDPSALVLDTNSQIKKPVWWHQTFTLAILISLFSVVIFYLPRSTPKFATPAIFSNNDASIPPPSVPLPLPNFNSVLITVKNGDTPQVLLERLGVSDQIVSESADALDEFKKENEKNLTLKKHRRVFLQFEENGKFAFARWRHQPGTEAVIDAQGDTTEVRFEKEASIESEKIISAEVTSSFSAAMTRIGVGYDLVDNIVDLFSDRIDFNKDFREGDRFSIIFREQVLPDGKNLNDPIILAASIEANGTTYSAIRFVGHDGKAHYYNEKGELLGNSFLRYPLQFSRISSYFTESRFHPVLKTHRPHYGIDFAAPVGTPVRTVASGKIVFAGYKGPAGNMVMIRHGDRYSTVYMHLSKISPQLKKGYNISKGELIGAVGATGLATGPHLHFGLFDRGKYINPLLAKLPTESDGLGLKIIKPYLSKMLNTLASYQSTPLESGFIKKDVTTRS